MDDLKPCPFCGGMATKSSHMGEDLCTHNIVEWHKVSCPNCDVSFEIPDGYDCGTATEQWNSRADDAETDNWKSRAEFAEAQLEAVLEQLPPPAAGLLKKRLAEKTAGSRTPTS